MNKEKHLKQTALLIFVVTPLILIVAVFNPLLYFPTLAWYLAGLTMLMGFILFIFANAGFAYIMKRAQPWREAGSAEPVQNTYFHLTKFLLGVRTPGTTHVIVNLKELPFSVHFFGRWICYRVEDQQLELWRDHPLFGSKWYFIQY